MNKQGNTYTFLYASIMVIVVAAVLAFVSETLKPMQNKNVEVAKKIDILKSVGIESDAKTAEDLYAKSIITTKVINMTGEEVSGVEAFTVDLAKELKKAPEDRNYPLYVCKTTDGEKMIIPLRGVGLWGPVWGYISLDSDGNTVYGAVFDHKGETPGLGAEISKEFFQIPFKGKTIFDTSGTFTSIQVLKGTNSAGNPHAVDAISGGTITSNGVSDMLDECLRGYEKYLKK